MKSTISQILLWVCLVSIAFGQKQIDTFNILFPEAYKQSSGKSIELVITEGGCFEWVSSSPDVVTVTGLSSDETNCHRKGVVELKHVGAYPASVYITATNRQTQELSNIPVRIRPITRIEIMAKSKLMNINEMQDLNIFAYDKDHNMFTSLEGLKFEWELVQNSNILSKISLKNSHLILGLNERKNIEMKGAESDILVIRGDSPGKALVRVRCIEPGYEHLKHEIVVSVNERFDINPSLPTYIMVNSQFKFNLITPSRQEIVIPKSYYKTSLSSVNFKVTDTLQLKAPLSEDQTVLKVEDLRTVPSYSAEVMVYAKEPTSISLVVDEYIIVGEEVRVSVDFMWGKHLLQGVHQNYKLETTLPFDKEKGLLMGKQKGSGTVKALYKNLVNQKKVNIVLPLKQVLPSNKIVLPIDESFELKIIGGSGSYEFKIEGGDIAGISSSGMISARKEGNAKIIVIDRKVPRNKLLIELVVSPVSSLISLEAHKELNVNEFGPIFTVGKSKNYQLYTKCNEQPILLETSHLPIFQISNEISFSNSLNVLTAKMSQSTIAKNSLMKSALLPLGVDDFVSKFVTYINAGEIEGNELKQYARELENYGICSAHWVRSSQDYDDQMDVYLRKSINVRSRFNLRVYEKITSNVNKEGLDSFIMTPFASLDWKTLGGSYKWDTKTRTLLNSVEYHTDYPTVKCPEKQTLLQMKILKTNLETPQLLLPVNQTKTIYIQCKYPSQLKIKYEKQTFDSATINGLKNQLIRGQLVPFDSKGEQFYNSSNLVYEVEKTAGIVKISKDFFEFDTQSSKNAKVTFWTDKIQGLSAKFPKVSTFFNFNYQQMFEISPHPENDHLITLFNPKTSYSFKLIKASENCDVECEGSVECRFSITTKEVKVNTTRLGNGKMKITNRGLYDFPSLVIGFEVVDADQIVLKVGQNTVEVQKKVLAEVSLLYMGKLIPTWQYDLRNLLLVHEAGIRSRQIAESLNQSNLYQISTQKPGVYKLTAQQHYPRYLQSSPVLLKVYPKFETSIPHLSQSYTKEEILEMKGEVTVAVNCGKKIQLHGGPDVVSVSHMIEDDDVVEVEFSEQNSKQVELNGLEEGKTKVTLTVTSKTENTLVVAIIELLITVKQIDHATIYSLEDAVINAQFRVIPYLVIDNKVMVDSVCDFQYKWYSDASIKLHGLNTKKLGINATALTEGDAVIRLEVLKKGKLLFTSTKQITLHKSLDIELPTIIGQSQNAISTNMLLPPNSGLNLDSNIYATKMSECDQNMLSITQNKLITSREKGMVSIKLQKTNDNTYSNYMNVIVTEIRGLFIENSYSSVSAELGKITKIKFHVQDMYGRLFYNNLFNVEYDVVSSNEDVFTVSIDQTRNFIQVHPKKEGEAKLLLKLHSGQKGAPYERLLEIPHDIVSVEVGKTIEPHSPIYLAVGGQVDIQYSGKDNSKWIVVTGGKFVEINPSTRKITALHPGEAIISLGGHEIIIRIVEISIKQKILQRPLPSKPTLITEYIVTGKWQEQQIFFQSISNTYDYKNSNLQLSCHPANSEWFISKSEIIKSQNVDKLRCQTTINLNGLYDEFPRDIDVKVISALKDGRKKIVHTNKEPLTGVFWLHNKFRSILLSGEKTNLQFFTRTSEKLFADVIGGQQSWLQDKFDESTKTHVFNLNVEPRDSDFDFKIRISHPSSDQTEEIQVKYIVNESSRHAKEEAKEEVASKDEETSDSGSGVMNLFMGWHWTDFIIVIMALVFLMILLSQSCFGSESKYKTL